MAKWHYDYILEKYKDCNVKVGFSDTDSLLYWIESPDKDFDIYKDMYKDRERYDLSNFPKEHPSYDPTNHKIAGLMSEEMDGSIIVEFCGNASKMYALLMDKPDDDVLFKNKSKTASKGIPEKAKREVSYWNYVKSHEDIDFKHYVEFNTLRGVNHNIGAYHIRKKGLCSFDDKSYIYNDYKMYRWGDYRIPLLQKN